MTGAFKYELMASDGLARRGRIHTAHGTIETPAFMPVGTAGTVKAMTADAVRATGAEIVLGNTYHLILRPTAERVAQLGGLHEFMDWPGPILTDSGGFQVMSLSKLRKMDEDGVTFSSHVDGRKIKLTPERSMEIQDLLDADITMAFDECTPYPATHEQATESMRLSMRWAARCREAFRERPGYGLFGIVQGSIFEDLRQESVDALTDIGFDGYAIGGLAVGEGQDEMFRALDFTGPMLPDDRPRYLMGVGRPLDIVGSVLRGIDMFDCVMPTRSGRTGQGFTRCGVLNIRNARHVHDDRPLDEACECPTCRKHSRGYLHHLFKANEMLGPMLLTWHNLRYYQDLMAGLRAAIEAGNLADHVAALEAAMVEGDIPATPDPLAGHRRRTMSENIYSGLTQLGAAAKQPASPEEAVLERVANPQEGERYIVRFTMPEFTSLCPITGQPDFAHLVVDYVPGEWLVESKSLKLYLSSFRNHGAFHEDCTVAIAKRLRDLLEPIWIRIGGYWYPRGGMPIDVFWQSGEPPEGVWIPDQGVQPYRGRG